MTRFPTPLRAASRAAPPTLATAMLCMAALLDAPAARAFKPTSTAGGESTPLNFPQSTGSTHTSSGGASIVRTIVGLLIVIAVIWGLTWILKQVKSGRERTASGRGLSSLATLPLGSGRSMHLVRAGSDYLLLGSAEHGVAPIHRYTEEQAREIGLLELIAAGSEEDSSRGPGSGGGSRVRVLPALVKTLAAGRTATSDRARARAAGERPETAGQRRAGAAGQRPSAPPDRPPIGFEGGSLLDRLREWTVRR